LQHGLYPIFSVPGSRTKADVSRGVKPDAESHSAATLTASESL
jgi:hypothetical protein